MITRFKSLFFGVLPRILRIALLRAKGVGVSWKSSVSWSAEISLMGGAIEIGENTAIDKGAILRTYGGSIRIGANCTVNPYCVLYGHGGLSIGDGVRIATHSVFIPSNHIFQDTTKYIYTQGETMLGIDIGNDVWIGNGVCVLDGVTVGNGVVIAAGSVVNKSLDALSVYAGVPAKKVKTRENKG